MRIFSGKKTLWLLGAFIGVWLGIKYLLPILLPFLLGGLVALAAEPAVRFATTKAKLPRAAAAPIAVSGVLMALVTLVSVLGALLIRELGALVNALPDLRQTAQNGVLLAQDYLINIANSAPDGVRPLLTDTVLRVFDDGTAIMDGIAVRLPGMIGSILTAVPDSALGLGTGIIAAFMISSRLPKLKAFFRSQLPEKWQGEYLPALRRVKGTLWGWLKAQCILALITYVIVTVGFLFMRIPFAPAWAALVAVVDAVPLLGTGTLLGPCALVCVLQGKLTRAVLYLCIYALAAGTRAAVEPRLVGRHLGLDPLATLLSIYVGYRFWGFLGLLLAPMLASAVMGLVNAEKM